MKRLVVCGFALPALSAMITVVVSPTVASAARATLSVPGRYHTIGAAIKAAHNGDTIVVAPGTYRENITIDGKYVTLKALSRNPRDTVIAGKPGRTPVMIAHVPARRGLPRVTVQGFRIANGASPGGQGGGVTVLDRADPVIKGNLIESNKAPDGGGIVVYKNSSPTIIGNTIRNNTARLFGGGILVVLNSSPSIYGNTISGNRATGGSIAGGGPGGGAIFMMNDGAHPARRSHPNVSRNVITSNSADFAGGAVFLGGGVNAIIAKNTITGNRSAYGGAFELETHGGAPSIVGNTISNNSALSLSKYSGSGNGGGIAVYGASRPSVTSNTISGNKATRGGAGLVLAEGSTSHVGANVISGNAVTGKMTANAGGGIYIANAAGKIENNVFRKNSAPIGGAVAALGSGTFVLVNNTVVGNVASHVGHAAGGGLYVGNKPSGSASVVNNIFAQNNDFQIFEFSRKATLSNNLITNDGRGIYFSYPAHGINDVRMLNSNPNLKYASENISGNPKFVNPAAGDYRLTSSSPAVDTGRSTGAPTRDMKGARRPFGPRTDVGACEYTTR